MRKIKLLLVLLILCVSAASSLALHENCTYSWNPSPTEHSWVSVERWAIYDGGWIYPFDSVPGITNTVDLGNTTSVNYAEVPAGQTAECLHLYAANGIDNTLIVNGTLNVSGDFIYGQGADNRSSVITLNNGSDVNIAGSIALYNTNPATVCKIVQNGGSFDVGNTIGIQTATAYPYLFSYELKGGSFNPGYVAFFDSGDGSNFVIDIAGGDLVMNNYGHFTNDLVAKGCILADGVIVTSSNLTELLIEDWAKYPNKVAFRAKTAPAALKSDFDGDGKVDFADFALFAEEWLRVNGL